jgi:hypothetical protein
MTVLGLAADEIRTDPTYLAGPPGAVAAVVAAADALRADYATITG